MESDVVESTNLMERMLTIDQDSAAEDWLDYKGHSSAN
jgi:hypothetical protein